MANQTNESLDAVQIKHWVTAVKNGQSPTIADKKEKTVKKYKTTTKKLAFLTGVCYTYTHM